MKLKVIKWISFEKLAESAPAIIALFGGIVGAILIVLGILPTLNGESLNTSLTAPGITMIFVAFLLAAFIVVFGNLEKNRCNRDPNSKNAPEAQQHYLQLMHHVFWVMFL